MQNIFSKKAATDDEFLTILREYLNNELLILKEEAYKRRNNPISIQLNTQLTAVRDKLIFNKPLTRVALKKITAQVREHVSKHQDASPLFLLNKFRKPDTLIRFEKKFTINNEPISRINITCFGFHPSF